MFLREHPVHRDGSLLKTERKIDILMGQGVIFRAESTKEEKTQKKNLFYVCCF